MMQSTRSSVTTLPAATLSRMPGAPDDSTPTIRDLRLDALDRHRHARDQAAAADRHHHHVDVRPVADDLEPHGPLAGDQLQIVEGMDVGEAALADQLPAPRSFASSQIVPCSTTSAP